MTLRTAIVTGAGSGVGRACALALLADGWNVTLFGRGADKLNETAAAATAGQALVVAGDISIPEDVDRLIQRTVDQFGRLDLLFNNAGSSATAAPIDEIPLADWDRVIRVNLQGSFLCARAAFGQMRKQSPQGGRIINNGSISAHAPRPGSAPYTTSKHAMTGLTKTLSLDGRPFRIEAGQLDIGNAATDMTGRMTQGTRQADGSLRAEPVMPVESVAKGLLYMANLPPGSNVLFMTVMASDMPFVGRG